MVNTQLLDKKIADSGKTKKHLAKKLGITIQTLKRKLSNESEFNLSEANILADELNIRGLTEKEKIFFSK